jgi:hypothetical protein
MLSQSVVQYDSTNAMPFSAAALSSHVAATFVFCCIHGDTRNKAGHTRRTEQHDA